MTSERRQQFYDEIRRQPDFEAGNYDTVARRVVEGAGYDFRDAFRRGSALGTWPYFEAVVHAAGITLP